MTDFTATRSMLKKLAMAHGAETAIGRACHIYRIMIRAKDGGGYWASAPSWQGGCGPWRICGPVIQDDQ